MFTLENNRYTIIPIEALSVVIEHLEGGKIKHVGCPVDFLLEDSMNAVRDKVHNSILDYEDTLDGVTRQWKKYQASKEYMTKDELDFNERLWKDFNIEKFSAVRIETIKSLKKSLFELTDFMLEHNVPLKKLNSEEDTAEIKQVSLEQVNNLLDKLGKKS